MRALEFEKRFDCGHDYCDACGIALSECKTSHCPVGGDHLWECKKEKDEDEADV